MTEILNKYRVVLIYLVLALAVRVVYSPVHGYSFVNYDDPDYVTQNPHARAGISIDSIIWAFKTTSIGNWHPLTWLSHMLDMELFGTNAGGHHVTSMLLHLANTLLLFAIFKRMTGAVWQSAFVAGVFALHPLNVESVAWIAERKNVLSTLFWLLTIVAYLRYVKKPSIVRYLPALIFFAMGLMSKPMLVTLPFVLLLLDYWPLERFNVDLSVKDSSRLKIFSHLLLEKLPFFVLSAVSSVVTFMSQSDVGALKNTVLYPAGIRFANADISYWMYLRKMVWPDSLAVFYPHPVSGIQIPQVIAAIVILSVISMLVTRYTKSHKYLAVGWLWYVGTLVPVIGLIQVGDQAMADRYAYVPLIGLFIMVSWGIADLLSKWPYKKTILAISTAAILVSLVVSSRAQLRYWQNSITLFEHAIDVTDNNWLGHHNLSHALMDEDRPDEAFIHTKEVIRIKPGYIYAVATQAWLHTGYPDKEFYNPTEAIRLAELVCRTNDFKNPLFLETLGAAYAAAGRFPEAVSITQKAVELAKRSQPDNVVKEIQKRLLLYKAGKPFIQYPKKSISSAS